MPARRTWRLLAGATLAIVAVALLLPAPSPSQPMDRPISLALPEGRPLRITAFGTSLTAGADWPQRLGPALAACLGHPVEVAVVARPGASSAWGRDNAGRVSATQPDAVLVEFAINDADLRDGLSLPASRTMHEAIVAELRAVSPAPAVVLMTMSPAQGLRGWMRPFLGRFYDLQAELARSLDAGLLDLRARWMALPRPGRGLERDGLHPDPEVATAVVLTALVPYLGRAMGRDCARSRPGDGTALPPPS